MGVLGAKVQNEDGGMRTRERGHGWRGGRWMARVGDEMTTTEIWSADGRMDGIQ